MSGFRIFLLLLLVVVTSTAGAVDTDSLVGVWRVIGDDSGETEALVRITVSGGRYEGTIIKVIPRPGVDPDALCDQCHGDLKNHRIQGLVILKGLRKKGDEYLDGEILDPDSGDIYRCKASLSKDERKLYLRGFVGISLFGRTQVWLREEAQ